MHWSKGGSNVTVKVKEGGLQINMEYVVNITVRTTVGQSNTWFRFSEYNRCSIAKIIMEHSLKFISLSIPDIDTSFATDTLSTAGESVSTLSYISHDACIINYACVRL